MLIERDRQLEARIEQIQMEMDGLLLMKQNYEQKERLQFRNIVIGQISFVLERKIIAIILSELPPEERVRIKISDISSGRISLNELQKKRWETFKIDYAWNTYLERSMKELKNGRLDDNRTLKSARKMDYENLKNVIIKQYENVDKYHREDALKLLEILKEISREDESILDGDVF